MRQLISRAMYRPDDLVIEFDYRDSKGATTHRVVSPIRFLGADRFLALCLSREEPRQFHLAKLLFFSYLFFKKKRYFILLI